MSTASSDAQAWRAGWVSNRPAAVSAPTAVYRLFGKNDTLLYVGVTDSLGTRWRDHSKQKSWWSEVVETRIAWYDTRTEALAEEARAIKAERPKYNIAHSDLPKISPASTLSPQQIAAVDEIQRVVTEREKLQREVALLDERERAAIEAAWRAPVAPTEIAQRIGRSTAHVRKLRPDDVPPARTGGAASRKQSAGADPE